MTTEREHTISVSGTGTIKVALSVGVMPMVRSDLASSGVIFTLDTESGFRDVVVVTVPPSGSDPDVLWRRFLGALNDESRGAIVAIDLDGQVIVDDAIGFDANVFARICEKRSDVFQWLGRFRVAQTRCFIQRSQSANGALPN
mgnify:CR=1 FL=1